MKKPVILQPDDRLMGADESIHTVSLIWSATMPRLPKICGVCVEDISVTLYTKRFRPLPHQFVSIKNRQSTKTAYPARSGFCAFKIELTEARVLPNKSWLQQEGLQLLANARHSGCQPATALGMGCGGIVSHQSAVPGDGLMRKPSDSRITSRPSSTSSLYLEKRLDSALMMTSGAGGWIRRITIPAYRWGGYARELAKSLSWVTNMRQSASAIFATALLDAERGTRFTSPSDVRNFATSLRTFSSTRNSMFESNYRTSYFRNSGCESECGSNVRLGKSWIGANDILNTFSGGKHFKHEINHDACILKHGLTVANGRLGSYVCCKVVHISNSVAQRI